MYTSTDSVYNIHWVLHDQAVEIKYTDLRTKVNVSLVTKV